MYHKITFPLQTLIFFLDVPRVEAEKQTTTAPTSSKNMAAPFPGPLFTDPSENAKNNVYSDKFNH